MKSTKGGRIVIDLSTPEVKNLPESIDGRVPKTDTIIESIFGSIIKNKEIHYTIHIALFNCFKQHDWGYLKFYLEKNNDIYHLPTVDIKMSNDDNVEDAIKQAINEKYNQLDLTRITQVFQDNNNLYVLLDDDMLNSLSSDNQRWFISNEMNEPYVHELCRNVMKYEEKFNTELSNDATTIYSSDYAYICALENEKYVNVIKNGENHTENHPIIEHNIIGRTHIFSANPLDDGVDNIRKYVYPINTENTHILDVVNKDNYATLKDTSLIKFNDADKNKLISIKPRKFFIET
jgi:hypothetical protein